MLRGVYPRSSWMAASFLDMTYNAGGTRRIVHPHPVWAIVRVKVLASVFVKAAAATHLH